jgi:hypothetical protein
MVHYIPDCAKDLTRASKEIAVSPDVARVTTALPTVREKDPLVGRRKRHDRIPTPTFTPNHALE